jgi:ornithine cyclodeaminase/alanine dehydrogenase-like protein (mu-crystallin family)
LLARADASSVGIIGSGFQACTQVEAMRAVRAVRQVKVWSRSEEKRTAFARDCAAIAVSTAEEAVRGADIIITATNSKDPVLEASWVAAGAHVNAMGSNQPNRRELPAELIERADLVTVDSLEQARMESGDLLLAGERPVVELKDAPRRPSPSAITIFKSNGIAVEDVVSAGYVYEQAMEKGLGRELYS